MADDAEPSAIEAERWMAKAQQDLAVAELLLRNNVGANWAACFHAQQAAEKALKAVLVALGVDFPRSHMLERLVGLMPIRLAASFDSDRLAQLTPWAVAGRYPEGIPDPDEETTAELIATAEAIVATATRAAK